MRAPSVPVPFRIFDQAAAKHPGEAAMEISARFEEVVRGFPNFDQLDPFTAAMIGTVIDRDKVKQALGRLQGSQKLIRRLGHLPKREFLGRLQSTLKKLTPSLKVLGEAQQFLKRLPDPTAHYSVCLAGFPNAGKSTMLKALTGAKAAIANYEFTTKTLNYGATEIFHFPVQFVDTPGTLNRTKTNPIERQAQIALAHLADSIVFIYDPLRDEESQAALFKTLDKYDCPIAVYASKQDILEHLPSFAKGVPLFTKPKEIIEWITPEIVRLAKER